MTRRAMLFLAVVAACKANADTLMVVDFNSSTTAPNVGQRVIQFDPVTGAPASTFTLIGRSGSSPAGTYQFQSPVHAIQVGNQVWVSDQLANVIWRFKLDGTYAGSIGPTGLSNIRGMSLLNGKVYLANAGTANGSPGPSIVIVDAVTGAITGNFLTNASSPWHCRQNPFSPLEFLVSNSQNNADAIERYSIATGAYLGRWDSNATGTGASAIKFPQMIARRPSTNTLLIAGFSVPAGHYEYNSAGNQINVYASGVGGRACIELGSPTFPGDPNDLMFTKGDGVWRLFPASGSFLAIYPFNTPPPTPSPTNARFIGLLRPACAADVDRNGAVGANDLSLLLGAYGSTAGDPNFSPAADIDGNGAVGANDLSLLLTAFGQNCNLTL
ncbi:MAG: hypothetical protein IBJ11_07785 [Phycisphaerales bacterium]|nr:hypothetical protein [Phycisphaerales bacterium]